MRRQLLCAALASGFVGASARGANLSDVLGVTHIDGKYYFTNQDYVDEGTNQVLGTGSSVIKMQMDASSPAKYSWNSNWAAGSTATLTSLAQSTYFKSAFDNPGLSTYVLTTYSPNIPNGGDGTVYWYNGMTASQKSAEQTSFYNLTKYLMTQYKGTGKTFVLENWEGDWALRGTNRSTIPSATSIQGMIDWFNAREAGIKQARAELGASSNVKVLGCAEVNRVQDAMEGDVATNENNAPGWATVTNDVLPKTNLDMASYSSYDTEYNTSGTYSFANAVQYIASKLPSSAFYGQNTHSVGIGEFGVPEDARGAATVNTVMNNVVNTTVADGLPYAVYWEIYSNELKTGYTAPVNGNNAAVNGYWMIKPDGTPATAWHQYRRQIITADPTRATTAAITGGLHVAYQSNFGAPGATLGSPWSIGTYAGDMSVGISGGQVQMKVVQNASAYPYGLATLNIAAVAGHGLRPGEYLQFDVRRENGTGVIGVEAFGSHHGSGAGSGTSPLNVWDGTWTPYSFATDGSNPAYDWDTTRTLGLRLDSADGQFATISYYIDGSYAGSWLYQTTATTLDSFSFFAQSNTQGATFDFNNLAIFQSVPEPGTVGLLSTVAAATLLRRPRRKNGVSSRP